MIRNVLGAIAGYIVFFFVMYLVFTGFSVAMGPDRLFLPGKYEPSAMWIAGSFVLGFLCAALGAYVAALIGKSGAVKVMAGIVIVIGVLVFVMLSQDKTPIETRTVDLPTSEAMFKAREPLWVAAVNPFVLLLAVFTGGALRKKQQR